MPAVLFFSIFFSSKFRCVQDAGNRIKAYAHTLYKIRTLFFYFFSSCCLVRVVVWAARVVVSPVIYHFSFARHSSKFFSPPEECGILNGCDLASIKRRTHARIFRMTYTTTPVSDTDLVPGGSGGGDSISKRHNDSAKIRYSRRTGAEHIFALTFL